MITLATTYYQCGTIIPKMAEIIPRLTSTVVDLLKIGVPVILIIFGMLDFGKAAMSQKEDEIKKNQQIFLKRLLSAALVFFVFIIVEVIFNLVSSEDPAKEKTIWDCVNCFINGPSSCEEYVPVPDEDDSDDTPKPETTPTPEPDEPETHVVDPYFTMLPNGLKLQISSKAQNCRCHPTQKEWKSHIAIDISTSDKNINLYGTEIYAFDDGVVEWTKVTNKVECGSSMLKIKHTTDDGKVYYTRYLHLNRASNDILSKFKKGDSITKGQIIGYMGGIKKEDSCSTGPHLHFEVYNSDNKSVDPKIVLDNQKNGLDLFKNQVLISKCSKEGACS